ncbi:MAG: hypothetical protein JEZ08_00395 [Clostridiales bacterium]|nr:hypothetical protein [Clostridiales bacterium]
MFKKMITFMLILTMVLSTSVMVFAEESTQDLERTNREERVRERPSREKQVSKLLELFTQYNPGQLNELTDLMQKHQSFHEMAKAWLESKKAEFQAERESIRAAVEAGQMTQDEVRAFIESKKQEREIIKAERIVLKAEKQAAVNAIREQRKSVNGALREALQSEVVDEILVQSLLSQLVDLLSQHLEVDYYYFNLITTEVI